MKVSLLFAFLAISGWALAAPMKFKTPVSNGTLQGAAESLGESMKQTHVATKTHMTADKKGRSSTHRRKNSKGKKPIKKVEDEFGEFQKGRKRRDKARKALRGKCEAMETKEARQLCYNGIGDGAKADYFAEERFKLKKKHRKGTSRVAEAIDNLEAAKLSIMEDEARKQETADVIGLFNQVKKARRRKHSHGQRQNNARTGGA